MKLPDLDYLEEDTDGCRQALERAEETARIPSLNRRYAAWHGEGSAASADEDAVFTFSDLTPISCAEAPSLPNATCTPMHGAGRAATLKNATQRTVEAQTQEINKIAMRINAAFRVPCINTANLLEKQIKRVLELDSICLKSGHSRAHSRHVCISRNAGVEAIPRNPSRPGGEVGRFFISTAGALV